MSALDDLRAYLGQTSASDDTLTAVLTTETAAQSRRVRFPLDDDSNPIPQDDLTEALHRRCAVNLARRGLPLGLTNASADGDGAATYLPGNDPEVRRLEAPWRRLPVG